jgi:hypothetical protein
LQNWRIAFIELCWGPSTTSDAVTLLLEVLDKPIGGLHTDLSVGVSAAIGQRAAPVNGSTTTTRTASLKIVWHVGRECEMF